jgi:hypothetical protein
MEIDPGVMFLKAKEANDFCSHQKVERSKGESSPRVFREGMALMVPSFWTSIL